MKLNQIRKPITLGQQIFCVPRGFTIIELLVVVLIIGILAAVALPQYQKAVEKSEAKTVISLLHSFYRAQQTYYLANGEYATKFAQLDINIPCESQKQWAFGRLKTDTCSNNKWSFQLYKNADTGRAISAGRLTGPYKGAAWLLFYNPSKNNVLECVERKQDGVIFQEPYGRYCGLIFGGKLKYIRTILDYQISE